MPEWWLLLALLGVVGVLGFAWAPLLLALPLLALGLGVTVTEAAMSAQRYWRGQRCGWRARALTTSLYLLQPLARLVGRVGYGLTPWRRPAGAGFVVPRYQEIELWSERWHSCEERLETMANTVTASGVAPSGAATTTVGASSAAGA